MLFRNLVKNLSNIIKVFVFLYNMQAALGDLYQSDFLLFQVQRTYHTDISKTSFNCVSCIVTAWEINDIRDVKKHIFGIVAQCDCLIQRHKFYWKKAGHEVFKSIMFKHSTIFTVNLLAWLYFTTIHVYCFDKYILSSLLTCIQTRAKFILISRSGSEVLIHFLICACAKKYLTRVRLRFCPLQV
jgi:hypothetical protein